MSEADEGGRAGAAAARLVLGAALRRLRGDAGLSAEQASTATGVPAMLIAGLERGQADVRFWDVAGLYSAYGVSDQATRAVLLGLAHRSNCREWWHSYRDVIPAWLEYYVALEQAASLIRCYCAQVIPVLLQVPGYARSAIARRHGDVPERDVARDIELRMRRQQVLHGPAPARLWAVIDEAALRRQVAAPAVMREQLRHLIAVSEMPNVTIHVLPFSVGGLPATVGGLLAVLRLPDRDLSDIGYLEQLAGGSYFHSIACIDYFRHVLNQLVLQAELAGPSQRMLTTILKDT
jgi:hypothetical protein